MYYYGGGQSCCPNQTSYYYPVNYGRTIFVLFFDFFYYLYIILSRWLYGRSLLKSKRVSY